jgi:peroxiredoxin Q/BCP
MNRVHRGARAPFSLVLTAVLLLLGARTVRAADVEVGQPAPDFHLLDQDSRPHSLSDYRGRTLVLAFYPKDFTAG